jgi:hypothetical protein
MAFHRIPRSAIESSPARDLEFAMTHLNTAHCWQVMDGSNEQLADEEAYFMEFLNERILIAEERELLEHYDRSITKAERLTQASSSLSITPTTANVGRSACFPLENKRGTVLSVVGDNGRRPKLCLDVKHVVQSLQYVKVVKLVPRSFLGREDGRTLPCIVLEDAILEMFKNDALHRLSRSFHWKDFQIRLQSANPSSWRLHVAGYRQTVDLFLTTFKGRLQSQTFGVDGLEARPGRPLTYVVARKKLPRSFFNRYTDAVSRKDLESTIAATVRNDCHKQLGKPGDWLGFRLRLQSADPTSCVLEVSGFRHTVNVFMTNMELGRREQLPNNGASTVQS